MKLKELPNTVVHCKTKDEYDQLMALCEDAGWRWTGDDAKPTQWSGWRTEWGSEKTGEYIWPQKRMHRSAPPSYTRILSFPDFLREQGLEQPLEAGDWVEVVERFNCDGIEFAEGSRWQITDFKNPRALAVSVEHIPGMRVGQFSSDGKRSWVLYPKNLKMLRKCSPPITTFTEFTRPLEYTVTWDFSSDFISSPIPSMSITDDAVSAYRHSKLNPVERRLRKVGFKDEHGNWTEKAVRTYMEMLLDGDGQKVLDPIAKTLLKKKDEDDE